LKPKFNLFVKLVSKSTGLGVPHVDVGMMFGLIPFHFGIYSTQFDIYVVVVVVGFFFGQIKTVIATTMFLKGFGGLLFIFSSSFGAFLLVSN
jgi:hypothetical protein